MSFLTSHYACEVDMNCPFVILLEDIEAQSEFMINDKDFITIENLVKIEEHAHSCLHFTDFRSKFRKRSRKRVDHDSESDMTIDNGRLDHIMERSRICVDMLTSGQSTFTQYMENHLQTTKHAQCPDDSIIQSDDRLYQLEFIFGLVFEFSRFSSSI